MSGTPPSNQNGQIEDNDDEFYSPTNEGNGMLYCNPTEENVSESPALGASLVAKFDSAVSNMGSENPPIEENTAQIPKTCITAGSVLHGSSSKGIEGSGVAARATNQCRTSKKTRGDPIMTPSPRARNLADTFQQQEVRFSDGYDSDGELGPFSSVVEIEGKQDFEEEALPEHCLEPLDGSNLLGPSEIGPPNGASKDTFLTDEANAAQNPASNTKEGEEDTNIEADSQRKDAGLVESSIDQLKVAELKKELKKRKCAVGGNKGELIARLKKAAAEGEPICNRRNKKGAAFKASKPEKAELTGFRPEMKWKVLVANEDSMPEPENPTFSCARAPTVPEEEAEVVPVKYNFNESFDQPTFSGTYKEDDRYANGRVKLGLGRKAKRVKQMCKKGGKVNPKFVCK